MCSEGMSAQPSCSAGDQTGNDAAFLVGGQIPKCKLLEGTRGPCSQEDGFLGLVTIVMTTCTLRDIHAVYYHGRIIISHHVSQSMKPLYMYLYRYSMPLIDARI